MAWEQELDILARLLEETGMESRIKWNHPVYFHAGRNVASCSGFKHHCSLWFFDGALLTDGEGVLENAQEGRTQAMRHWKFRKGDPIPEDTVAAYLREAMANAERGLTVTKAPLRAEDIVWCDLLQAAFDTDPDFMAAMHKLTPGRQRDYNVHIGEAKREATQLSRLEKIRPLVLAGHGLHDKYRKG